MMYGISGTAIPSHLEYAPQIQAGCQKYPTFPPCLAYAIPWQETIGGEKAGLWVSAATVESGDGGHGLFQLTSSYPSNWENVDANVRYALEHFLVPGMAYFAELGMRGDGLIRCIAAGFNSGNETAWENHLRGNVDLGTTDNYAQAVLTNFHRLISGKTPFKEQPMPGILQTIATDANLVTSLLPVFLSNLAKNPTVQIIEAALEDIAEAITTRQTSFRIANYSITAKLNGSPAAFTVSAAVLGLENVVAGKTGVFTSGDIEIDIQPVATTTPSAPVISAPVANS